MNTNPFQVVIGIFLLFTICYAIITAYTYIYLFLTKDTKRLKAKKLLLSTAVVSLAWLVSTVVTLMFVSSSGVLAFSLFALILIFGINFFLTEKLLGFKGRNKLIYCLLLAVILNPGWVIR